MVKVQKVTELRAYTVRVIKPWYLIDKFALSSSANTVVVYCDLDANVLSDTSCDVNITF